MSCQNVNCLPHLPLPDCDHHHHQVNHLDCLPPLPEEDEVSVDVDGALQGGEHVGDEEPLRGAHPEHVLHVLSLLES